MLTVAGGLRTAPALQLAAPSGGGYVRLFNFFNFPSPEVQDPQRVVWGGREGPDHYGHPHFLLISEGWLLCHFQV